MTFWRARLNFKVAEKFDILADIFKILISPENGIRNTKT